MEGDMPRWRSEGEINSVRVVQVGPVSLKREQRFLRKDKLMNYYYYRVK